VVLKGAGTTTITAGQAGNDLYDPAPEVSQPLVVEKAIVSVKADNQSRAYGEANPVLTISYRGFAEGENEEVLDTKPVASTVATQTSDAGEYPITVSGGSATNYRFRYGEGTLSIGKAEQTITFGELPEVKKGDDPLPLTATASSGLTVTYTSSDLSKVTISGSSAVIVESGMVEITAGQGGNLNYFPALDVIQLLVIKKPEGAELLQFEGPLCYPNPFDRALYLNEVCQKALSVRMCDLNGRVVLVPEGWARLIDCSTLKEGVYLLEIDFGQGTKLKRQVIKK